MGAGRARGRDDLAEGEERVEGLCPEVGHRSAGDDAEDALAVLCEEGREDNVSVGVAEDYKVAEETVARVDVAAQLHSNAIELAHADPLLEHGRHRACNVPDAVGDRFHARARPRDGDDLAGTADVH